jgi:hypothetical protein
MSAQEPTDEELQKALEEQMRRLTVMDVLVQTAVTLVNLGAQKLGEERDLDQARQAIEGVKALMPLLPDEVHQPLRDALSQLQMAFARESQDPGGPPPEEKPEKKPEDADEAEREKARAKIWTPPGA